MLLSQFSSKINTSDHKSIINFASKEANITTKIAISDLGSSKWTFLLKITGPKFLYNNFNNYLQLQKLINAFKMVNYFN